MPQHRAADAQADVPTAARPPFAARALMILWPAFLMAGVLETLVFAVVDPLSLHGLGGEPLEWTRTAVYSVTFLIFWAVIATAAALSHLLEAEGHA